jgi:hypothetical protein
VSTFAHGMLSAQTNRQRKEALLEFLTASAFPSPPKPESTSTPDDDPLFEME